jgi:Flp pilus assembly protein TadG
MVEFALIVIIFMTLLMGMLQFGIYLNAAAGVVSLAREGARYAAVKSDADASVVKSYMATSGVLPAQLRADKFGYGSGSTGSVTVEYYNSSGTFVGNSAANRSVGGVVKVIINYDMSNKLIIGPALTGAILSPTYKTSASFRVEQ